MGLFCMRVGFGDVMFSRFDRSLENSDRNGILRPVLVSVVSAGAAADECIFRWLMADNSVAQVAEDKRITMRSKKKTVEGRKEQTS